MNKNRFLSVCHEVTGLAFFCCQLSVRTHQQLLCERPLQSDMKVCNPDGGDGSLQQLYIIYNSQSRSIFYYHCCGYCWTPIWRFKSAPRRRRIMLKIDTASYLQNSFIVSTICIDKIRPLSKLPAQPYREK